MSAISASFDVERDGETKQGWAHGKGKVEVVGRGSFAVGFARKGNGGEREGGKRDGEWEGEGWREGERE